MLFHEVYVKQLENNLLKKNTVEVPLLQSRVINTKTTPILSSINYKRTESFAHLKYGYI